MFDPILRLSALAIHLLYTILQIFSLTLFEKIPINQLVKNTEVQMDTPESYNQLNLFN
ncbi:MAG: hypothetical protein Q8M57_05410 [Nitrosomonas sp.]|nr:hypothetical protein [Nitrosomonas sp.]